MDAKTYWDTLSVFEQQRWARLSQTTELSAIDLAYTNRKGDFVGAVSIYAEDVRTLETNLRTKIRELKRVGVVAMSPGNLRMVVSTRGLRIAPSVFDKAFNEALANIKVKGFEIIAV